MSEKLNQAIALAAQRHAGQYRKMGKTPYIIHPMEVASIISTVTEDEEVMIAGLLHDTVEETETTPDEIEALFGARVRAMVESETEDKQNDRPREETWKERKRSTLKRLIEAQDIGIRILWMGDKLANMRSLYRGYRERGDGVFEAFHQKDKKEHEWYYRTISEQFKPLEATAAYAEYNELLEKVFHD